MKVFIPRIPASTTKNQLWQFCQGILDKKLRLPFIEAPRMLSCDVVSIKDQRGSVDNHGIVSIVPDKAAEWFITQIKKHTLNGKKVFAREYKERSQASSQPPASERRRPQLKIEKVREQKIVVEALESFQKK